MNLWNPYNDWNTSFFLQTYKDYCKANGQNRHIFVKLQILKNPHWFYPMI